MGWGAGIGAKMGGKGGRWGVMGGFWGVGVPATHEKHVRQVDVLCKHRRSTCMRDRDLCCNNSCISHGVKIYRAARRFAARRSVYAQMVRYARIVAA